MASNQVSNQRKPNGPFQGPQSKRPSSTNYSTEETRDYGSLRDVAEGASEYWARGEQQMAECIRGREATALLTAVAAGVGVGLVIGAALGYSQREKRTWRDRITAEGFGRRLLERIESVIPDALAEHFSR